MKVLVIIDNLEKGGIANVVNNFSELFNDEIIFDYITYIEPSIEYKEKLKSKGSNYFLIKRVTKTLPNMYIKSIKKIIIENGGYDAIHIHTAYFIWLGALAAKHAGICNIVGHAHGSEGLTTNFITKLVEKTGRKMNKKYCTKMFACSEKSGVYTFGRGFEFLPNVIVMNNSDFVFNDLEKILNIKKSELIIGYLGMFTRVKNSNFLLNIAKYLINNKINNYKIIAAGEGVDFCDIVDEAKKSNLKNIEFLGYRKDVFDLLNIFDVLIVPSLSEGMSLSILEAQLIGTPVLASKGVPLTNDLNCGLFYTIDNYLERDWIEKINCIKEEKVSHSYDDIERILSKIGYDYQTIKSKLISAYSVKI